ncbi:MAG: starvation-sensing protein RspA [Candidatus Latescibacteria bacterium]|nr:starvation-sensing protein RspA [Candidatus Latescibacterota bacterium]
MAAITIKDVKTILTQPAGSRLIVVKLITSEPGLYGVGCATFTQRFHAVHTAIEKHLKPFLIGRDVDRIEETWQMIMVNGYWRNGPVLNNALSGVDQALWDIKGKRADMPVYQLLGGKCREAAACYSHAGGDSIEAAIDSLRALMEQGYHYLRLGCGGYGGKPAQLYKPDGAPEGDYFDRKHYMRVQLALFERARAEVGDEIELCHDIHERLQPIEAVGFAKDLEEFKLFFLEDPLAPEDLEWFKNIRQQCATPIAMGELFNHPREWQPLIEGRLIDFIRMHVSQMGGITPARHVAAFANMYGIRTAWHGPGDTSPVGHAANLHLDLWAPNFGIQEWCRFPEQVYEIFPGLPVVRKGYMYPNDSPGLGIDVDEKLAANYPCKDEIIKWTQCRLPDGSPARP